MKFAKFLFVIALMPLSVHAANYEYSCEADADGSEGLCLAEPTDLPSKKKVSNIAETQQMKAKKSADSKTVFGVTDANPNMATTQSAQKMQNTNSAAQAMRAQEKIRQVETFLQPMKGSKGFSGEDGPMKAGSK